MYDMTKGVQKFWTIKLITGKILNVEVPKLKVLRKISKLSTVADTNNMTEEDMNNLISALSIALSRNKERYKVSEEWVEENINIIDVQNILTAYFSWINELPNLKN